LFCIKNGKTSVNSSTKGLEATLGQFHEFFIEGMNPVLILDFGFWIWIEYGSL
jgi:hypothetical protein